MEVQKQRRQCSFQQRRTHALLRFPLLALVFFFAMLLMSCHAAAARPLDVAYTDEFRVTDGRNSKPSSELQENESDAYQEDISQGSQFVMRGVYLKENDPEDLRRLPPPPPIVRGALPPCPAPPPPQEYFEAKGDAEGKKKKKEKKEKKKKEEKHAEFHLDCAPIL